MTIKGTKGNDNLKGTSKADIFDLSQGGNDTLNSLGGNDTIKMGAALTHSDAINGGTGVDTLELAGNYSGTHAVAFGTSTITNIEKIVLDSGHSYDLTTNDATVANGKALTVDGSGLTGSNRLIFDGSAETNGTFRLIGGNGNDNLVGGAHADTFYLTNGGNDTASGGGGGDTIALGSTLTAADKINGGAGSDTLTLNGTYTGSRALVFGATTVLGVEKISLAAGHNYSLTANDATVASGGVLAVDASALGSANKLTFDGSAETNGLFHIKGGAGNDTVSLGAQLRSGDTFNGGAGDDTLVLNGDYLGELKSAMVKNVETIVFSAGHNYAFEPDGSLAPDGATVTLDAHALESANSLQFLDTATTGGYDFIGGAGNDLIALVSSNVLAHSTFVGGSGTDSLELGNGGFSAPITFGETQLTGFEKIVLSGSNAFSLTMADGNVAAGGTLIVNASSLDTGGTLTFDGSAETNGAYAITGGAGADAITFASNVALGSSTIDGGGGNDTLTLNGDFSGNITLDQITSVEKIVLGTGHTYNLTVLDSSLPESGVLTVDASALDAAHSVSISSGITSGSLILTGGAGNDVFAIGGPGVLAASTVDGGGGANTLYLDGDYSSAFSLTGAEIKNIAQINLTETGHAYNLLPSDAVVDAGKSMIVNGSSLTHALTFNASAETDGSYYLLGGTANDSLTGTIQNDRFDIAMGGHDSVAGNNGNDTYDAGSAFEASDQLDGGNGLDVLNLDGDYATTHSVTFGAATLLNFEEITCADGHSYTFTMNEATVASGKELEIDASALTAGHSLNVAAQAETNGFYDILGGAGNDMVVGSSGDDYIDLGAGTNSVLAAMGADHILCGAGTDTLQYNSASESTGVSGHDLIDNLNASVDMFDLNTTVTGVASPVSAAIAQATFDTDLASAVAGHIGVDGAILATETGGALNGRIYLVIDANGNAAYNPGTDYVFEVTNHTGTFTTATFF